MGSVYHGLHVAPPLITGEKYGTNHKHLTEPKEYLLHAQPPNKKSMTEVSHNVTPHRATCPHVALRQLQAVFSHSTYA